jgi:peptidoglycan-N-acetylglucosamine deacetylase
MACFYQRVARRRQGASVRPPPSALRWAASVRRALLLLLVSSACATTPAPGNPGAPTGAGSGPIEVALTVDDLPRHGPDLATKSPAAIAAALLDAFRRHRVPQAYGFVNAGRLDEHPGDRAVLDAWLAAGHPLGNHTWGHADLHRVPVHQFIESIDTNETFLAKLQPSHAARPWKKFRYPYLHEGTDLPTRAQVRAHLLARGAEIAHVTIDPYDWAYNQAYVRCLSRGAAQDAEAIRATFLLEARAKLRWAVTQAEALVGRPVRHILLLHLGVIDADSIEELLGDFEERGVRWISLEAAMADPIYAENPSVPYGGTYIGQLYESRGVMPAPEPQTPVELLEAVCR